MQINSAVLRPILTQFPEEGLLSPKVLGKELSSPHYALKSLLFAPDGYPTATEDPTEIKETARIGSLEPLEEATPVVVRDGYFSSCPPR